MYREEQCLAHGSENSLSHCPGKRVGYKLSIDHLKEGGSRLCVQPAAQHISKGNGQLSWEHG